MTNINQCYSIDDLRRAAARRLPKAVFEYIDGAADDEQTLARNTSGFDHWQLVPEVLQDVSRIDTSVTVQGSRLSMPFLLSPTGMSRLFHHHGERATGAAAAAADTVCSLSSLASVSIEDLAAVCAGPKWFQIYVWRDRKLVSDFIERCRKADYSALCLTVDVAVTGNRERDYRNGLTIPMAFRPALLFDFARCPYWWWHMLTTPKVTFANVIGRAPAAGDDLTSLFDYVSKQFDPSVTWDDAKAMIRQWGGKFLVKGILSAEDAVRAVEIGASGIVVSNHGGRQLDSVPAPIDVLPDIVEAVAGRAEIILDGGVRRGTDILKALALGATACMAGRPYLYGLAAGGQAGVARALDILRTEIERDMALLGVRNVSEIGPQHLRRVA
ncbi:MAG: alpha-hydroxy acid oxidase [Gammaproteobacteria bacterium]